MTFRKDLDLDKIPVFRPRLGVEGRTFLTQAFSFKCSHGIEELIADEFTHGELVPLADRFSFDRFKADGTPTTIPAEAVFTRVRFWPSYTYDLKAGQIHLDHKSPTPSDPVRIFAQLAPTDTRRVWRSSRLHCGRRYAISPRLPL